MVKKIPSIADLLPDFIAKTGINRTRTTDDLAEKWTAVAGRFASVTAYSALRRGVLEITVSDTIYIQELMFVKADLLAKIREAYPAAKFKDLRFRVGSVAEEGAEGRGQETGN